jgi:thioredoxin-related protein
MEKNNYNLYHDEYSLLKTGDNLPVFKWMDEAGLLYSSEIFSGKTVLIILFASDCRHCRNNFSYMKQNIVSKNIPDLKILGIGRDCDFVQIEACRNDFELDIDLIADKSREIFLSFAEKSVPRIYLFDSKGKLTVSIRGYKPLEIDRMAETIKSGHNFL